MNKIQKPEITQVASSPANNNNIKVCILTSAHSPFDDRIFHKEAKTLAHAGYNVSLIAQHDKEEIVDGIRIIPLSRPSNRFERMTKIVWKLFRLALNEKADIYHFHDPELMLLGVLLKLLNKKVVYDAHEDYTKQILKKQWLAGPKLLRTIVSKLFSLLEGFSAKTFDCVVAATVDISENFPEKKTVTVRNFPILDAINKVQPAVRTNDKFIIIYAGGLAQVRGTKEIIQAMKYIGDKAELHLLGDWKSSSYEQECKKVKGYEYTRYFGYLPVSEVYARMKSADVGVSILYPIKNYLTSLPVKAYEYMACSLPMVMSNFPYWQQIFGECALFADPYSPEDIADRIIYLLDNPDKAKQMAGRGRQLVVDQSNWENESKKLLRLYDGLMGN